MISWRSTAITPAEWWWGGGGGEWWPSSAHVLTESNQSLDPSSLVSATVSVVSTNVSQVKISVIQTKLKLEERRNLQVMMMTKMEIIKVRVNFAGLWSWCGKQTIWDLSVKWVECHLEMCFAVFFFSVVAMSKINNWQECSEIFNFSSSSTLSSRSSPVSPSRGASDRSLSQTIIYHKYANIIDLDTDNQTIEKYLVGSQSFTTSMMW